MLDQLFERPTTLQRHLNSPLLESRLRYLKYCAEQGATKATLQKLAYEMLVIIDYLHLDTSEGAVDVTEIKKAANRWISRQPRPYNMIHSQRAKVMFISVATNWLRFLGRLHPKQQSLRPYSSMIDEFTNYMSSTRGFSKHTIQKRCMHVEEFLSRFYHQNLTFNQISITEIQEAIASKGSQDGCARSSIRIYANSLRAFFRYAEMRDWCKAGLATAIMSPCVFREETLPAGPSWKDIQRLIASISDDNPTDIRDRAILMLIAIYGLRSSEVGKLRIEDINWEKEQILVRCAKQGQTQLFPLSYTVGEAILLYLKEVRPRCQYREVFLAMRAPIQPLTHTGIYCIVSKHLRSLDISTNHYGPHSLRHACASHLLAEGLSLKEIGDYLGHRSPRATRIYAKVDINGLREVADFQLGGLL